jgi:hypothetical protein
VQFPSRLYAYVMLALALAGGFLFSGDTQRWVTFASAAAIVATSIAAQVVNVHASELPTVRRVPETKAA